MTWARSYDNFRRNPPRTVIGYDWSTPDLPPIFDANDDLDRTVTASAYLDVGMEEQIQAQKAPLLSAVYQELDLRFSAVKPRTAEPNSHAAAGIGTGETIPPL